MARHVCWDPELVRRVFTTEASTKVANADLLRLHLPLDRIRVLDAKPMVFAPGDLFEEENTTFTSESGLLRAIRASRPVDPNRIFVIVGEPGAGKSHLARWLELSLEAADGSFPIHIPRHVDSLSAVVARLEERTGIDAGVRPDNRVLELPPDKLVRYILAALELELGQGTPEGRRYPQLAAMLESRAFRMLVEGQIARYQAERRHAPDGLKTREILAVGRDNLQLLLGGAIAASALEAYHARLASALRATLLQVTNLGGLDLKRLLGEISRRCVEREVRPVLVLEDVTSFDMLHDDLMMFLLDESAGHFDAIVCWTTGFERNYMQTYQEQRYTARLSLTDEQGEAYSLKHGRCVELVRHYLDAVRIDDDACPMCARYGALYDGLYPFNAAFIQRIYDNLVTTEREQRRTPRHLLDRAVKAYLELAELDGAFPPLRQPAAVQDVFYDTALYRYRDEHPAFVSLMAWYGARENGSLRLSRQVARQLGVAVPDELDEEEVLEVHLARQLSEEVDVRVAEQQLEARNRFKALRLELQAWYNLGTPLDHYADVQRGVVKLMQFYRRRVPPAFVHPGGVAGAGKPMVYGRGASEANILVRGSRMQAQRSLQLQVGPGGGLLPDEQNYLMLETALALHVLGGIPEGTNFALLDAWTGDLHARYRADVEQRLAEQLGLPPASFLLFAKFLLLNQRTGMASLPVDEPALLLQPVPDETAGVVDDTVLAQHAERLDGALRALFFVSRDVLDEPRLRQAMAALDLDQALAAVAAIAVTRVDEDARFPDGARLPDLVRAVKGVCAALRAVDLEASYLRDASELCAVLEVAAEVAPAALLERLQHLHHRIGSTEAYELYDAAHWRGWRRAVDDWLQLERASFEYLVDRLTPLLQPPTGIFAWGAWSYAVSEVRRLPDYQIVATALRIVGTLEPQLTTAPATGIPRHIARALSRRDALRAALDAGDFRP